MGSDPTQLTIHLLGAPEIRIAGAPVTLNHLKARALLFYLAATGQFHTRDHLTALLWSDSSSGDARHSLRSTLYRLRQALRPGRADGALIIQGDLVHLQLGETPPGCDATHFRRLLGQGNENAFAQAMFLYRGRFLQGFTLTDAPMFEEWVRFEETELNQAYLNALDRLATWVEGREEWATAIGYVQRVVQADPLGEAAQRRLMELYIRNGMIGMALRQYRQFEALLRQELGLAPSPETQALFRETFRHPTATALPDNTSLRQVLRRPPTLPLVGREELMAQMLALSQKGVAGRGATVLMQGEGGIGKSRLLEELAGQLAAWPSENERWLLLQGGCSPFDDGLSHGPFFEAFQSASSGDLIDLLSESYEAVPDARGRFFWRILQTIRALARNGPLLITIDDLQWANSSTLNLFGFLALRLHDLPVILVGTVQRAEAIPALQRLITLGRRRGELHLFSVLPLSIDSVITLLGVLGVGPASITPLAEWLQAQSNGSPFILEEILAQMRADGILVPVKDNWRLDTIRWLRWRATFTLPETTYDLVTWRLANLSTAARHLLDVLAVAGRPLPYALLSEFPGVVAAQLVPTLDDLVSRRLVVEATDSSLTLPHHLLREALMHRLSNLRLRTIHQQLAEAMETCLAYQSCLPVREIALHAVAGEDVDRARHYGLQVLAELPQTYAGAETVNFLHHLHDLLAPTASPDETCRLTYALGRLHHSLGHLQTASGWYQQTLGMARKSGDVLFQVITYFEMGELALVINDYAAAAEVVKTGLAVCAASEVTASTGLEGRGHRLLGAVLSVEGSDLLAAEQHLQQAVTAHRLTDNLRDLCATLFELGNVAAQRGDIPRALELYQEAKRVAESGQVHYFLALAYNNFAYHSLLLGRPGAAQHAADQGLKLAESYDMLGGLLYLYSTQGEIHLYLGEWEAAAESFGRGLALAEELGHLERQAGYRAGLALAARGQSDPARAVALLEEALLLITEQGYWHLRTRIRLWLAETLLLSDRNLEARHHLEAALTMARAHNRALLLTQAERLHARCLAAGGDWLEANALFAETLKRAEALNLPLEVARTQAAWGEVTIHYSPTLTDGQALLAEARATLTACDARAELQALSAIQLSPSPVA